MKSNLQINGRVELDHKEISRLIIDYLKERYRYKVEKVIFELESNGGFDRLKCAVVEIRGQSECDSQIHNYHIEQKKCRISTKNRSQKSFTLFDTIRSLLNDAFVKNGNNETSIEYEQLSKDVFFFHPDIIDDVKLKVYLHDKRQLPNTEWSSKTNKIVVRSIINH